MPKASTSIGWAHVPSLLRAPRHSSPSTGHVPFWPLLDRGVHFLGQRVRFRHLKAPAAPFITWGIHSRITWGIHSRRLGRSAFTTMPPQAVGARSASGSRYPLRLRIAAVRGFPRMLVSSDDAATLLAASAAPLALALAPRVGIALFSELLCVERLRVRRCAYTRISAPTERYIPQKENLATPLFSGSPISTISPPHRSMLCQSHHPTRSPPANLTAPLLLERRILPIPAPASRHHAKITAPSRQSRLGSHQGRRNGQRFRAPGRFIRIS